MQEQYSAYSPGDSTGIVPDDSQHTLHPWRYKVALVTDARVGEILPGIVGHFVEAEVKHFEFDNYEAAVEWIE